MGIEPTSSAWKAEVITTIPYPQLVEGGGFEPPKLSWQIYNLLPLATREPLHVLSATTQHPKRWEPLYESSCQLQALARIFFYFYHHLGQIEA